ncbi:TonB-dependent receptor [Riemerella anatipestifer]|uniref:TonB-dependent receptor n=1 Tax=Riemerella anatipestifer TaxID=34085 RepID=UPI0030BADCD1
MKRKSFLLLAGVATFYFNNTFAQTTQKDSVKVNNVEEVIITGSANPKKRIESSIAITTMKAKDIQQKAPQSTADILQYVPGFLAENSGGEVGNNLFARGIPSAGAYEYVQIQEDGLPIFEDGALQFANIDNFQRLDLTLQGVEAVRGGTASVFASGAPGGIVNFISKTGQNDTKGTLKLSTSTFGLFRTDFNIGGALVQDKLFFNAGGFYREDNGMRSPGFKANRGGQIKLNLTYKFDKGYARVYYKYLNDRAMFYQVTPFIKNGNGVKAYPGFDPNYGTFASMEMAQIRVPQYGGGFFETDLRNGVHPVSHAIGTELKYKLSDVVTVHNNMKFTSINQDYNAIFAPSWMGSIVSQNEYSDNLNIDRANAFFTYVNGGGVLDPNEKLKRADLWFIRKNMQNLANNLNFNIDLDKVKLNVGHYYSNWSSDHYWNWNSFLVTASDKPRLVNLQDTSTGTNYTYNGVSQITWLERQAGLTGNVNAFFANADIEINDKFNANVGVRYDINKYKGYRDNARFSSENLGVLPNSTADDKVTTVQGAPFTYWSYNLNKVGYTAALNYKINNKMAVYFRQSHGFRAPIEEAFYDNANKNLSLIKPTTVNQSELGYTGQISHNFALYGSAFLMNLKNIFYGDIVAGGKSEALLADVRNLGLELEAQYRYHNFSVSANATFQKPEYTKFASNASYVGNQARRIPKTFFSIRPSYDITKGLNVYARYSRYGTKYNDEGNTFVLKGFGVLDAGASYQIKNIRFALDATNITNNIGLTEGDGTFGNKKDGDIIFARSIVGALARFSITLDF